MVLRHRRVERRVEPLRARVRGVARVNQNVIRAWARETFRLSSVKMPPNRTKRTRNPNATSADAAHEAEIRDALVQSRGFVQSSAAKDVVDEWGTNPLKNVLPVQQTLLRDSFFAAAAEARRTGEDASGEGGSRGKAVQVDIRLTLG